MPEGTILLALWDADTEKHICYLHGHIPNIGHVISVKQEAETEYTEYPVIAVNPVYQGLTLKLCNVKVRR